MKKWKIYKSKHKLSVYPWRLVSPGEICSVFKSFEDAVKSFADRCHYGI